MIAVLTFLLTFLASAAYLGYNYLTTEVGSVSVDEMLFHLAVPLDGTSDEIASALKTALLIKPFIIAAVATIITGLARGYIFGLYHKRHYHIKLSTLLRIPIIILALLVLANRFLVFNENYHLTDYLKKQSQTSTFIADNYVDPNSVELKFPEDGKKRNLIYIYLESMESTYADVASGGAEKTNYIPELTTIANENINFSNNDKLGGAYPVSLTTWTIAGMVAQTAGLPLKIPVGDNEFDKYDSFLAGATNLGDILEREGYQNESIFGSGAFFGGRDKWLQSHGNYKIKDYYTASEDGIIPADYNVFWGFEDSKLFEYAKQELATLSASDQPFNLSLLTVNTHFPDGYLEPTCPAPYSDQYLNVIRCSSAQVADFLDWLKTQPYYENTTIVISGDHLTMANNDNLFGNITTPRTVYNAIINSANPNTSYVKNRTFSTLDMFPTTLSALGVEIPGSRLALGTDLFSGHDTLLERYGLTTVNDELESQSTFYNNKILYGF